MPHVDQEGGASGQGGRVAAVLNEDLTGRFKRGRFVKLKGVHPA